VREEVQSFRAVAQMSARSALAKHSWNNLRNQIFFKVALTAISAGATIWFGGTYFIGYERDLWKGMACGAATIVCLYRLFAVSSEMKKVRHEGKSRTAPCHASARSAEEAMSEKATGSQG